jgi:hypothetical protein
VEYPSWRKILDLQEVCSVFNKIIELGAMHFGDV